MTKAKSTTAAATESGKPRSATSVTLRDVARFAGVSSATVSRMMNRPEAVSRELRERIAAAINHLGWVPHAAARALATQRTGTIGAVFPTVSNEHFATAIQELQEALESAGYTLLLGCSQYDTQREYNQIRNMLERGIDAVVLVGESHHPDLYATLAQRGVPYVNTFAYRRDSEHLCVGIDNRRAFFEFTTYLLSLGHRRFAMLSQTADSNDRAWARREGVRDALAEHGLGISAAHMAEGFWGVGVGRKLFSQVMSTPQPPTAIICGNGTFAIGAMLEAAKSGYDVPNELTIAGFDDFEIMSELPIPITTVSVPSAEIGRKAAHMILEALSGAGSPTSIECDAEIMIRASSAPPATRAGR